MIKLLPLALVMMLILGALLYFRFTPGKIALPASSTSTSVSPTAVPSSGISLKPTSSDINERLRAVEEAVPLLAKKVNSNSQGSNTYQPTSQATEAKIKNLESLVTSLQQQIDQLKNTSTTTPTSSKSVVYIPLGGSVSSTSQDWATIEGFQISLDPADYPGFKNMQLEVNIKLAQSIGTGYVRLMTGGSAVASSDASTTAATYTLASSGNFTLASGRKTYQLQIKTDKGYELYLQSARIKVNF